MPLADSEIEVSAQDKIAAIPQLEETVEDLVDDSLVRAHSGRCMKAEESQLVCCTERSRNPVDFRADDPAVEFRKLDRSRRVVFEKHATAPLHFSLLASGRRPDRV